MIVRPLIPQQSTVNGKRKVISRYENGGEAAKTGIAEFIPFLKNKLTKIVNDPILTQTIQAQSLGQEEAARVKPTIQGAAVATTGLAGDIYEGVKQSPGGQYLAQGIPYFKYLQGAPTTTDVEESVESLGLKLPKDSLDYKAGQFFTPATLVGIGAFPYAAFRAGMKVTPELKEKLYPLYQQAQSFTSPNIIPFEPTSTLVGSKVKSFNIPEIDEYENALAKYEKSLKGTKELRSSVASDISERTGENIATANSLLDELLEKNPKDLEKFDNFRFLSDESKRKFFRIQDLSKKINQKEAAENYEKLRQAKLKLYDKLRERGGEGMQSSTIPTSDIEADPTFKDIKGSETFVDFSERRSEEFTNLFAKYNQARKNARKELDKLKKPMLEVFDKKTVDALYNRGERPIDMYPSYLETDFQKKLVTEFDNIKKNYVNTVAPLFENAPIPPITYGSKSFKLAEDGKTIIANYEYPKDSPINPLAGFSNVEFDIRKSLKEVNKTFDKLYSENMERGLLKGQGVDNVLKRELTKDLFSDKYLKWLNKSKSDYIDVSSDVASVKKFEDPSRGFFPIKDKSPDKILDGLLKGEISFSSKTLSSFFDNVTNTGDIIPRLKKAIVETREVLEDKNNSFEKALSRMDPTNSINQLLGVNLKDMPKTKEELSKLLNSLESEIEDIVKFSNKVKDEGESFFTEAVKNKNMLALNILNNIYDNFKLGIKTNRIQNHFKILPTIDFKTKKLVFPVSPKFTITQGKKLEANPNTNEFSKNIGIFSEDGDKKVPKIYSPIAGETTFERFGEKPDFDVDRYYRGEIGNINNPYSFEVRRELNFGIFKDDDDKKAFDKFLTRLRKSTISKEFTKRYKNIFNYEDIAKGDTDLNQRGVPLQIQDYFLTSDAYDSLPPAIIQYIQSTPNKALKKQSFDEVITNALKDNEKNKRILKRIYNKPLPTKNKLQNPNTNTFWEEIDDEVIPNDFFTKDKIPLEFVKDSDGNYVPMDTERNLPYKRITSDTSNQIIATNSKSGVVDIKGSTLEEANQQLKVHLVGAGMENCIGTICKITDPSKEKLFTLKDNKNKPLFSVFIDKFKGDDKTWNIKSIGYFKGKFNHDLKDKKFVFSDNSLPIEENQKNMVKNLVNLETRLREQGIEIDNFGKRLYESLGSDLITKYKKLLPDRPPYAYSGSGKNVNFYKDGGEVRGVGSLSDIARNMFKQPRGVVTLSSVARNMFI
jgi:hypothetical protein